jgi:hypothetical protein
VWKGSSCHEYACFLKMGCDIKINKWLRIKKKKLTTANRGKGNQELRCPGLTGSGQTDEQLIGSNSTKQNMSNSVMEILNRLMCI